MPKAKSKNAATVESNVQQLGVAEIYIYGEIGESWFEEKEITGKTIADQLSLIPGDTQIHLHINSPGGDVNEGLAIYNLLRKRSPYVTAFIDGYACSAASFIALAADKVVSPESSIWMIHPASGFCYGTASDMRSTADVLDVHTDAVLGIYAERTGKSREEVSALLESETWFTGKEALEMGFATQATSEPVKVEQVLPRYFQKFTQNAQRAEQLKEMGWEIGRQVLVSQPIVASANTPAPIPTVLKPQETPIMDENTTTTTPVDSSRITQMADQIRDLKVELNNLNNAKADLTEQHARLNIVAQYWQQRAEGLALFARNRLTEDDFSVDFSEDPQVDLESLQSMDLLDAQLDIKVKARSLRRAAMKKPIERVTQDADKPLLNNTSLKSMAVDLQQGEVQPVEAKPPAKTPTGEPVEDFAARLVAGLKIK